MRRFLIPECPPPTPHTHTHITAQEVLLDVPQNGGWAWQVCVPPMSRCRQGASQTIAGMVSDASAEATAPP